MKLSQAQQIANEWLELLAPYCTKIKIAGSIRRQKPEVKDIEIVAIPKPQITMLEDESWENTEIFYFLHKLASGGKILIQKDGSKQKQIYIHQHKIWLDLFLVKPPAQWGKMFALRTGPAEYSQWLVTRKRKGGATPSYLRHRDGALWTKDKTLIKTPTEKSFYQTLGIDWVEPELRGVK